MVLVALVGLLFLLAHLRALPQTLEDVDSINFALGVESFDVASHRPHPPGYPVYVALTKASTAAIPLDDRDRRAAIGLAIWGVIAGTLAAIVLAAFWTAVGLPPTLASLAAIVGVASPLFWFTASRPLTDVIGVVAAIAAQLFLIRGWQQLRMGTGHLPRPLIVGAAAAGLAIGLRSQSMWINGPFLLWCVVDLLRRRTGRDATLIVAVTAGAALVWAIPLLWDSGGLDQYLRSLRSQGTQDVTGAQMFVVAPSWKAFTAAVRQTFMAPWLTRGLAQAIVLIALVGAVRLAWRQPRVFALVAVTFVPYLAFHLAFQEVGMLRYSLPIVIAVAGCFVIGAAWLGLRVAIVAAVAAAIVSVVTIQPRLEAYAADGWSLQRAFQDMIRARPASGEAPLVRTHHQVWHGVQRLFDWYRPIWDVGPQPFPGDREWLGLIEHWRTGATRPVWFLGDLTRNDVTLFDPRSRRLAGRYATRPELRPLIGVTTRLDGLNWWVLERPFWMLGTGWSLTPEIAGMTRLDKLGPQVRPAEAFLARTSEPVRVLIGGRHLDPDGPAATLRAELDGRLVHEWAVSPRQPWFVEWIDLPSGVAAGSGSYAPLTVTAVSAAPGRPAPWIGLEQFDATTGAAIHAFTDGWHELEHDPATGRTWRWTTARSTLQIRGGTGDARLTLAGESPLTYFPRAPVVAIHAGDRLIQRFNPAADFEEQIVIPASALDAAGGTFSISTDLTFVPGDRENTPDRRVLGLRLFRIDVAR